MVDIIEYTGHHPNFLPSYIIVSTAAVNIFCLLMMYRLKQRLDIDFRVCFRFVHRRNLWEGPKTETIFCNVSLTSTSINLWAKSFTTLIADYLSMHKEGQF